MKRILILFAATICGITVWADTIAVQQMGIQYYLPKTEATISVRYTQKEYQAGIYAKWAQKLLGIDQVIEHDTTTYDIKKVRLETKAVPDKNRVYTILPEAGKEMQLISVTNEGILQGYNIPAAQKPDKHTSYHREQKDTSYTTHPSTPSLLESTFKNDSAYVRAKNVAKQIFQLRDNRAFLLAGELENMPSDGAAIQALLKEMEKQEKALTALFTGSVKTHVRWVKQTIDPATAQDTLLCIIGQDSLRINVEIERREAAPIVVDPKAKPKKGEPKPSQICYNLPGVAHIRVTQADTDLLDEMINVAQLGISIPLNEDLFIGEPVHIVFDTKTGNILSITRGK